MHDATARLWEVATGRLRGVVRTRSPIEAVAWSPDASGLALVESAVSACDKYGGGEAAQAAFCTELFEALERHKDKLEFGGWFNLHDFPPAFLGTLTAGWGVDSAAFSCWLGGLALATFEGQPRPVYAQWAVEARKLYEEP